MTKKQTAKKDISKPVLFGEMSVDQLKQKQKELGIKDSDIKGSGKNGSILKLDRIRALERINDITVNSENDTASKQGSGSKTLGKKSKAQNKEILHPTYKVMIGKAILAERNKKGSTLPYIKKYLETNYLIDINRNKHHLNKEITKLTSLTTGARLIVNPNHTGHYRLSDEYKGEILGKKPKTSNKKSDFKYYLFYLDFAVSDEDLPMYYGDIIEAKDEKEALKIAKKELKNEDFTKEEWELLRVKEFKMIKHS